MPLSVSARSASGGIKANKKVTTTSGSWRPFLQAQGKNYSLADALLFLAPALAICFGLILYPLARTFYNSFFTVGPHNLARFVGLKNFAVILFKDPVFWKAVRNTAVFSLVGTALDVACGFVLALCLFAKIPLARLLRVVWFTPVLMSYVVVGIIWMWIYDYHWGIVDTALRLVGLGTLAHSWLGDPRTALWAVVFTQVWKWAGFNMIVFLAALYALPADTLGAAELDSCGWLTKVVYVIIPMLRSTIASVLILSFIGKMMMFDLVWVMTRGGPLWSTETVSTYVYKRAFDWNTFDLGYPSAVAVIWFIIILGLVVLITRVIRSREKLEF
ncbi:MAG TPA: sugar ABC transporter permease [Terriglobia bacterium]|nr:sugar ABC transporter permease [Terriglobia bacterium]